MRVLFCISYVSMLYNVIGFKKIHLFRNVINWLFKIVITFDMVDICIDIYIHKVGKKKFSSFCSS